VPFTSAGLAVGFVDTKGCAACGASPLGLFCTQEGPHAAAFDSGQVVQHAHAILGAVSFIQSTKPIARKAFTLAAAEFSSPLGAGPDAALENGFALACVFASATRALVLIAQKSVTETAIHAAGGNESRRR
jgi:hypothetical protein